MVLCFLFHVSPPIRVDIFVYIYMVYCMLLFKQMLQKPTKTMCQIATKLHHFGLPWLTPIEEQLFSHMAPLLLETLSKLGGFSNKTWREGTELQRISGLLGIWGCWPIGWMWGWMKSQVSSSFKCFFNRHGNRKFILLTLVSFTTSFFTSWLQDEGKFH